MNRYCYLVREWDECQGPVGSTIGVFSSPSKALDAIRNYLSDLIIFHNGDIITSDDLMHLIEQEERNYYERDKTQINQTIPASVLLHTEDDQQFITTKYEIDGQPFAV